MVLKFFQVFMFLPISVMNRAEAQYVFPDEGDNQLLEGSIYGLSLYF